MLLDWNAAHPNQSIRRIEKKKKSKTYETHEGK